MSLSGVSALSISDSIRGLSERLVGIFVPLYIFSLAGDLPGFDLKLSLLVVLAYDFIRIATSLVLDIPIARVIRIFGYRRSIFLGTFFKALVLVLLIMSRFEIGLLFLAALVAGLRIGFYFQPYHVILAADGSWTRFGQTVGRIQTLMRVVGSLGPLIGGVITELYGFPMLLEVGLILLVFSAIPYLFVPHRDHDGELSFGTVDRLTHQYPGLAAVFIGSAVNVQVRTFIYPIFVLMVVGSLAKTGGLISISLIFSSVLWWLTGLVLDHHSGDGRLAESSLTGQVFVWLARGLIHAPGRLLAVDALEKVSLPFSDLPMFEVIYRLGKPHPHTFILFREFLTHIGGLISVVLLMILVQVIFSWQVVFLVPAIGGLLTIWGMRRVPREALE